MLKWLLIGVGLLAGLAVAAIVALPWLLDTPAVHAQVAQAVSHALGRPVRFASLSVSALPVPTVRLKDLRVAEDPAFGTGPFVTVGEGRIRVRLWPLLSGRVELADLTLMGPRIALVKDAAGRLNIASLGVPAHAPPGVARSGGGRSSSATSAGAVLLSSLRIVDGSVQYQTLGEPRPMLSLRQINVTVTQSAPAEPLRLSGEAIAEPGSVRLRTTDARISPGRVPPPRRHGAAGHRHHGGRGRGADRRRPRVVPRGERADDRPDRRVGHAVARVGDGSDQVSIASRCQRRGRGRRRAAAPRDRGGPGAARREPDPRRQRPDRGQDRTGHGVVSGLDGARRRPDRRTHGDQRQGRGSRPGARRISVSAVRRHRPARPLGRGNPEVAGRSPTRDDARCRWVRADA